MRTKLAIAAVVTALAGLPFGAAPAQASETHLCEIWAPPFDRVFCTVERVICDPPYLWICQ